MPETALQPIAKTDWDERKARHLLNRAGFGIPHERAMAMLQAGPEAAVKSLVAFEGLPPDFREPDFLFEPIPPEEISDIIKGMSQENIQQASSAEGSLQRESITMLQSWWLNRMFRTAWPLQEKLALCWHGHFATSASKVETAWINYQLNQVFREHGSGDLKRLVIEVGQSPAMLQYLDNNLNVKDGPNENWARELMELFTLGIGNYTESDVKASARAFTGWTANHKQFVYREDMHDTGSKTVLGRTGDLDGWNVIDVIFEQPACANHFAKKLWTYFAYDNPEPEVVNGLAAVLRENRYQVKPMLSTMFLSRAFYSDRAMGTQVKCPVQLNVQLAHHLSLEPPPIPEMTQYAAQLGQNLFYPPNVKGWDGGRAWINTGALISRYNLAATLATTPPAPPAAVASDATMMMASTMGAGMMAKGADVTGSLGRLITALPDDKRKYVVERLGINRPQYRAEAVAYLEAARKRQPWDPKRIFNKLTFTTAGTCVDRLTYTFLNARLTDKQRLVLLEALGAKDTPDAPLSMANLSTDQMNSALHLLFSMAEYQVC